jgi:hypothetical protein
MAARSGNGGRFVGATGGGPPPIDGIEGLSRYGLLVGGGRRFAIVASFLPIFGRAVMAVALKSPYLS